MCAEPASIKTVNPVGQFGRPSRRGRTVASPRKRTRKRTGTGVSHPGTFGVSVWIFWLLLLRWVPPFCPIAGILCPLIGWLGCPFVRFFVEPPDHADMILGGTGEGLEVYRRIYVT